MYGKLVASLLGFVGLSSIAIAAEGAVATEGNPAESTKINNIKGECEFDVDKAGQLTIKSCNVRTILPTGPVFIVPKQEIQEASPPNPVIQKLPLSNEASSSTAPTPDVAPDSVPDSSVPPPVSSQPQTPPPAPVSQPQPPAEPGQGEADLDLGGGEAATPPTPEIPVESASPDVPTSPLYQQKLAEAEKAGVVDSGPAEPVTPPESNTNGAAAVRQAQKAAQDAEKAAQEAAAAAEAMQAAESPSSVPTPPPPAQ